MNKTLFLSQSSDQDPDQPQPEARMREALGLRTDGTRVTPSPGHRPDRQNDHRQTDHRPLDHGVGNPRRHRFVQEGEVPVEVMSLREHGRNGPGLPGGFERRRAEDPALAAERMAREQAERAFAELTERLREVKTKLGHAELARDEALALAAERQAQIEVLRMPPEPPPAPRKAAALKATTPRPRGRQKAPKPVKWWIKSTPTE